MKYGRIGVVLLLLGLSGCGYQQIPAGYVGVLFNGLTHQPAVIRDRVIFVAPWHTLSLYPTAVRQATYVRRAKEGEREGDDAVKATTREGVVLPMDVTLVYHVAAENVLTAFNQFGDADLADIQGAYLRWVVVSGVNEVSGQRSIFDLMSKDRSRIGPLVKERVAPMLTTWGISVDDVLVGSVYASQEINDRIQKSMNKRTDLDKATTHLQQAVVEARTIRTNAERQASQNALLANQGETALRLKKLALRRKAIEKWDGQVPETGPAQIPFMSLFHP